MAINLRNLSHRVVVTVIGASLGFAAAAMSDDIVVPQGSTKASDPISSWWNQ